MKTSFKVQMIAALAAMLGASAMLATNGCELIADFDRSKIDAGDLDAAVDDDASFPSFDANFDAPNVVADAGSDAADAATLGEDASELDAATSLDASDAADSNAQLDASNDADSAG